MKQAESVVRVHTHTHTLIFNLMKKRGVENDTSIF